jgi:hypothetical protein
MIEEAIQLIGLAFLKVVTLGRYRLRGPENLGLFEGTVGLGVIAAATWLGYLAF